MDMETRIYFDTLITWLCFVILLVVIVMAGTEILESLEEFKSVTQNEKTDDKNGLVAIIMGVLNSSMVVIFGLVCYVLSSQTPSVGQLIVILLISLPFGIYQGIKVYRKQDKNTKTKQDT